MKKLSWLLLATLMFAFTGCSNADDDPQENGGGVTPPKSAVEVCGDATAAVASYFIGFDGIKDYAVPEGWKNVEVEGDRNWGGKYFKNDGSYYISVSSYKATEGKTYESWIISPALDLTKAAKKVCSFKSAQYNASKAQSTFEVYALQCIEGKTIQTKLDKVTLATGTDANYQFVPSGDVDLNAFSGTIYIAFKYIGIGSSTAAVTWCVDDFSFGGVAAPATISFISTPVTSVEFGKEYTYIASVKVENTQLPTTITAEGIPAWAAFTDNGDGTATIKGTAPSTAAKSAIKLTAKNGELTTTQEFSLDVAAPIEAGSNLVVNGGFETWADAAAKPEGWVSDYTTQATKETTIFHSGAVSMKFMSKLNDKGKGQTEKLQQEIAIKGGTKYRISYWYLDNDPKAKTRIWSGWLKAGETSVMKTPDGKAVIDGEFLQPDGYSIDSPEWKQVKVELTAPADAAVFRFEARVNWENNQADGIIYFDDFEIVEIK